MPNKDCFNSLINIDVELFQKDIPQYSLQTNTLFSFLVDWNVQKRRDRISTGCKTGMFCLGDFHVTNIKDSKAANVTKNCANTKGNPFTA